MKKSKAIKEMIKKAVNLLSEIVGGTFIVIFVALQIFGILIFIPHIPQLILTFLSEEIPQVIIGACLTTMLFFRIQNSYRFFKANENMKDGNYEAGIEILKVISREKDNKFFQFLAGKKNNIRALNILGDIYSDGEIVPKDNIRAQDFYSFAAREGNIKAQIKSALQYLTDENFIDAYIWLSIANNKVTMQSKKEAKSLFADLSKRMSTEQIAEAKFQLSEAYVNGFETGSQDYKKAKKYLLESSDMGNAEAQREVGSLYSIDKNPLSPLSYHFPNDPDKAIEWSYKSARQGKGAGEQLLAWFYYNGEILPRDNIKAYMWCYVAESNRKKEVRTLINTKMLKETMSPADVKKAEAMAKRCIESNYKDCEIG